MRVIILTNAPELARTHDNMKLSIFIVMYNGQLWSAIPKHKSSSEKVTSGTPLK